MSRKTIGEEYPQF